MRLNKASEPGSMRLTIGSLCKQSAAGQPQEVWNRYLQPESQKLLWRLRATSADRDFHKNIRRSEGESWGSQPSI
jgi:hypothetical protein